MSQWNWGSPGSQIQSEINVTKARLIKIMGLKTVSSFQLILKTFMVIIVLLIELKFIPDKKN